MWRLLAAAITVVGVLILPGAVFGAPHASSVRIGRVVDTSAQFEAGDAPYADGTLLQSNDGHDPRVYVIVGGGAIHVPDPDEFDAMGYSWKAIEKIPNSILYNISIYPRSGTMVKYRTDQAVYVVVGSAVGMIRCHLLNAAAVNQHGGWSNVHTIPNGSLEYIPVGVDVP